MIERDTLEDRKGQRALPSGHTWVLLGLVILAILLVIAVVDRPASTFAHAAFHVHRALFDALTHVVDPLPPLATLGLVIAGVGALAGARSRPSTRIAITCCLAVVMAITLKDQAKFAFGRLWPEPWVDHNPSWIGDGAYGFNPFHGGRGWASFPSGHMTLITAPATVLWSLAPRFRAVAIIAVMLVAIGLYGADYHFVSDMIAGTVLGAACGMGAVALVALNWPPPAKTPSFLCAVTDRPARLRTGRAPG